MDVSYGSCVSGGSRKDGDGHGLNFYLGAESEPMAFHRLAQVSFQFLYCSEQELMGAAKLGT